MRQHLRKAGRATVVLAACAALLPAGPANAAGVRPACHEIAVSPDFAKDRTAFCTQVLSAATLTLSLYRTRDGGRTWYRAKATGLTWDPTASFVTQPQVSATFATDHRLVVSTSTGLYTSVDYGESFVLTDPRMTATDLNTPLVYTGGTGALAPALGPTRDFAVASGTTSGRTDLATGLHLTVLGVVGQAGTAFVLPTAASPGSPVLAWSATREATGSATTSSLWTCTDDLVCSDRRSTFPTGVNPFRWWRVALPQHRNALVVFARSNSAFQAYASTDDGTTFHRWTNLEKIVATDQKYGSPTFVSLAANPSLPGRVYARVVGSPKGVKWQPGAPPREQLFRSDDGGTTWRRVGYQLDATQKGTRGNLPWNSAAFGWTADTAAFALASDGRLLVPAGVQGESGMVPGSESVYCSLDGGTRWYALCPR